MNLFTGILSAAWWTQKATSVPIVALAVVGIISAALVSAAGGLWWLRDNAKEEERQACALAQANAKNDAEAALRKRVKAAEDAGIIARNALVAEIQAARERAEQLEIALASTPKTTVCYPKEVARRLNR